MAEPERPTEGRKPGWVQQVALTACGLLAAASAYLLLEIYAQTSNAAFLLVCAVLGITGVLSLLLIARDAGRGEWGSATAWGFMALPLVLAVLLLSLDLMHGGLPLDQAGCDPSVATCGPPPSVTWVPPAALAASAVLTIIAIRGSKVRS